MASKSQYAVALVNEPNSALTGVSFAASATLSSLFNCGGVAPTALITPSNWTACNVTFKVGKFPDSTLVDMYYFDGTSSGQITIPTLPNQWIELPPVITKTMMYFQVSCSVAQVNACTLDMGLAPIFQGLHN